MANNNVPEATSNPQTSELKIIIRPYQLDFWEYEGTRAQLESENVIPPHTQWPEGANSYHWESGRFSYSLRRSRPDGLKGPMRLWTSGDWWCIRCNYKDGLNHASRTILKKKRELAQEVYRHSPAGQREWDASWRRYWAAQKDEAYQAFRAKVPVLNPPKRGRKAKIETAKHPEQSA